MTTQESVNFYRVVSLLIDVGTDVLRKLFTKYAFSSGATSIYNYLCNEQAKIFQLQKSKYLKSHQVSLLLGHGSGSGIDINTWDINLLCVLLKNICPISQQEETAVENLRLLRNTVHGHAGEAKLSDSDFKTNWQKIEGELIALSQNCGDSVFEQNVKQTISKIQTGPLHIESTVEALKLWYAQDQLTIDKLKDIDLKLDQLLTEVKGISVQSKSSENLLLERLKDHSRTIIKQFNFDCFVETQQITKARHILQKENSIFIWGAAGEGKTTCAIALATSIDRDRLVLLSNPGQIEHIDPEKVKVLIIDDIFDQSRFDHEMLTSWRPYFENLQAFVFSGVKVIITLRQEIWYQYKSELNRFKIFANRIQLSSTNLSFEEKKKTLEKHLEINERHILAEKSEELVNQFKIPFGFPSCLNMFATEEKMFLLQEDFFFLPYNFIRKVLVTMKEDHYATLLFLFYKNGKCLDNDLKPPRRMKMVETNPNVTLLNDIAKLVGINPSKLSLTLVHDNLEILCDFLVKHEDKSYCFINKIIYNCIALYHGERYQDEVVENCTIDFLCQYVQAEDDDSKMSNTTIIVTEQDSCETLAERIIEEVTEKTNTETIVHCKVFQSKSFCKCLAKTLLESNRIMEFLSCGGLDTKADDSSIKISFLEKFIVENTDQLCVNIIPELLDTARKMDDIVCFNKIKQKTEELLGIKGYQEALQKVKCDD